MSRSAITTVAILGLVVGLGQVQAAGQCDRYVSGEGSKVLINQTCMFENGLPILYIEREEEGTDLEVVVPIPESVEWESLWKATHDWLADEDNLDALSDKISSAAFAAPSATVVVNGEQSQIEFINYAVGAWLIESGAAEEIALSADGDPQTEGRCSDIPICSSCQVFYCGEIGEWTFCNCRLWGQSCCRIIPQPA